MSNLIICFSLGLLDCFKSWHGVLLKIKKNLREELWIPMIFYHLKNPADIFISNRKPWLVEILRNYSFFPFIVTSHLRSIWSSNWQLMAAEDDKKLNKSGFSRLNHIGVKSKQISSKRPGKLKRAFSGWMAHHCL